MFGDGLAIRDEFDNVFMDYRDESQVTLEIRWNDRITYDGTWENNLFNFFTKVTPKLTADLKKPFRLEGMQRIDETPVHKAVREAFVNLIIHADYLLDAGTLKVIKRADGFKFTNPGILKLPIEDIYRGGNSKSRNPRMQTMLRMIGFGDNAGSGFPAILSAWENEGWIKPELKEDTRLNQVTLTLKMVYANEEEMKEDRNFNQKNERSLKEVLKEVLIAKDYEKMFPIIEYLEGNLVISTQIAEQLTGRSSATAWRYLEKLVEAGVIEPDGNTNNAGYKKIVK